MTRNANTVTRHLPTIVPPLAASAHDYLWLRQLSPSAWGARHRHVRGQVLDGSIGRRGADIYGQRRTISYPNPRLDGVVLEWLTLPKNR